jgi:hypothetical protein
VSKFKIEILKYLTVSFFTNIETVDACPLVKVVLL